MFSLFFDNNEKQGKRPDFLDEAWTYYKKRINKPEPANLDFDLMLVDEESGKQVGAEIKELDDFWGSLPPRGRLGRQCMDIALKCDYGYLSILGSLSELIESIPPYYKTDEGNIIEKPEERMTLDENMVYAVLGDIKSLGVLPVFLSRNPIDSFRLLINYMIHDIISDPPITLCSKPRKNMHAINVLCNLPGVGWERAEAILESYGSVSEFLQEAQVCLDSGNLGPLENLKINDRRFGKSAHKMFQVDGIWGIS